MKKSLFSLLFLILVSCSISVSAQEVKPKLSENAGSDRAAIEISIVGNKIFIENAPIGKKIEIFSVVGLKVSEIEIKNSSGEYSLNASKGYYILKISDTFRKVVIR